MRVLSKCLVHIYPCPVSFCLYTSLHFLTHPQVLKKYQPYKTNKKVKTEKEKVLNVVKSDDSTPKSRGSMSGIKLRERIAPMKYTLDDDYSTSSSEDESGEIFPKERSNVETWMHEVICIFWHVIGEVTCKNFCIWFLHK